MEKKRKHPMEILWICMAIFCLAYAILRNIKFGFEEAKMMYLFSALSVIMLLWRRHLRKKEEEKNE